jgi:hypothetical protein
MQSLRTSRSTRPSPPSQAHRTGMDVAQKFSQRGCQFKNFSRNLKVPLELIS